MSRKNKKVRMSSRIDLADALRKESSLSAFTFDGPYRLTGHDLLDNMYCGKSCPANVLASVCALL